MKKQIPILLLLLAILLVVALVYYVAMRPSDLAGGRDVRVGAVLPLTGPASHIGEWQRNGINLALAKMGSHTSGGTRITVIFEDSAGVAKTGLSAFVKLADSEQVTVGISSLSSVCNTVLPIADERHTPLAMISCSYPGIASKSTWTFRNHPGSEDEATVIAHFLIAKTSVRKVAVFYLNDDFGLGAQATFKQQFEKAGGRIAWNDAYAADEKDLRSIVTSARAAQPDGVYVIGYVNATAAMIKTIREMGMAQPMACNMAMGTPNYLTMAGEALEGAYFSLASFDFDKEKQGTSAKAFTDAYTKQFGKAPNVFAAMAYDTIGMIAAAADKSAPTRNGIRDGLAGLSGFPGAMGSLSVDAERNVRFPLQVAVLRGGQLVPVAE